MRPSVLPQFDGVLSAEEIRYSAAAILKLDKNGDRKVSRNEVTAAALPGEDKTRF